MTRYAALSLAYRPGEETLVAAALVADGDPSGDVGGVSGSELVAARQLLEAVTGK